MTIWVVFLVLLATGYLLAPALRVRLLEIVVEAFAVPVLTFSIGFMAWMCWSSLRGTSSDTRTYLLCSSFVGLPIALGILWWIRKNVE